jgi:hypothetical protein
MTEDMRRLAAAVGLAVLVAVAGLVAGSAAAGGTKKLVEGTVYDTTCATSCTPECPPPPHCGPITQSANAAVICAQRPRRAKPLIVCPLYRRSVVCVQAPCPGTTTYPVYSGEGAVVKVRKRGSATVVATLPVVEGHFKIALGSGQWVFHPYLPEEPCWSGRPWRVKVWPKVQGPIPLQLLVSNSCVAHPDVTK